GGRSGNGGRGTSGNGGSGNGSRISATSGMPSLAPGTLVFNLVEAPPGVPGVHPATAAALELLGLPFTGSSAASLWLTTDKLATRAVLAAAGLPVPRGGRLDALPAPADGHGRLGRHDRHELPGAEVFARVPPPWILKPACEDASLGLDGDAVCATREAALARAADLLARFPGQPLVVERFLPGRELNVSLLEAPELDAEPIVLPVAEIEFVDFPEGMPRIVGYEAKWQPESFAYIHTVRRFPHDAASAPLLAEARRLAVAAWRACGLAGYGRVDLRLDEHGAPHVLEVNANPCLAPDAGFMAAAEQAGLGAAAVIARIAAAAVARHRRLPPGETSRRRGGGRAGATVPDGGSKRRGEPVDLGNVPAASLSAAIRNRLAEPGGGAPRSRRLNTRTGTAASRS
ncbi:MAG: hypothetical protein JOZ15_21160, partial [Acidobacteria bacterium]|nr:hypothetical protein [Acidobacteriota bacterium]